MPSEFLLRSVACREYTLPRDDPASEAKGWIQGNTRIGPILEVTTSFSTLSNLELKWEFSRWKKTILTLGSEFRTGPFVMWTITSSTTPKVLQVHKKRKQYQQAHKWLQPDRRQKRNPNRGNLLARRPFHLVKEFGLILYHRSKISIRTICRREWSIFFDIVRKYNESKMEQFNSTRLNSM